LWLKYLRLWLVCVPVNKLTRVEKDKLAAD